MTVDECYQLGYVMKPHGYRGELMIVLDVDDPEEYDDMESVFLLVNQHLVPYSVEKIQVLAEKRGVNQAILKLEDVNTEEKALALKGSSLYLPLDSLPELDEDQFYFHEIVDYTVSDQQLGKLGTVITVYNLEHQDLIAMQYQNKEVLIPITDEIVLGVDREAREIRVNLPDGLLDVYLEE